jgi:hypothetical protein
MKTRSFVLAVVLAAAVLLEGCSKPDSDGPITASDPTENLPARFKVQEPVLKPDFSEAAASPEFQQAIKEASSLLGSQPQPLHSPGENTELTGGVSFDVPARRVGAILSDAHMKFLAKGFYLFRYEQNFGFDDAPDKLGLLPTTDKYAVMAAMETNGDNYGIGTAGVIAWMKELEQSQPFLLTGIGFDYMEGHFTGPVKETQDLARRMYEFCPDIVDQGVGTVDKLAEELEDRTLYFWWD